MLKLQVVEGNATGTDIAVEQELIIGRTASVEGRLADDPEISRQHARVMQSGDGYVVEDLGSMNGTFVNGNRLQAPHQLANGDQIEVGSTRLVAQLEQPQPGGATVTATAIPQPDELDATRLGDVPAEVPPPPTPPEEPAPAEPPAPAGPQAPAEPQAPAPGPQAPPPPPGPPSDLPPPSGPPQDTVTPTPVPVEEPAAPEPPPSEEMPPPTGPPQDTVTPAPVPVEEIQPPPRVKLHVEIDIEAGLATIELDEGADRVTLTHEEGRWVLKPEEAG